MRVALSTLLLFAVAAAVFAAPPERIQVTVEGFDPYTGGDEFLNLICYRLMQEDPALEVVPYLRLWIQGGPGSEATRYMAHAAGHGPDVTNWLLFHDIRSYVRHGFYLPLNEFIGEDLDGNGYVDDDEAIWPEWKSIPEFYRRIATVNGKVYGVPNLNIGMAALIFRKDLLRKEGIDPDRPPADFDELYRILQRLTRPTLRIPGARGQRGRYGYAVDAEGWRFCSWVWAAGGNLVLQGKRNPATGKTHWFTKEELYFLDPETGDDLSLEPGVWKADFGGPGGQRALEFYRRMRWSKWIRDPVTDEPVDLTEAEVAAGLVKLSDGRLLHFTPKQVLVGVCRVNHGADTFNFVELLRRGEVAMVFTVCDPLSFRYLDIPPENIGFWPVPPARRGQPPAMLAHYHYKALSSTLAGEENRERRQKAWAILSTLTGERGARWETEYMVRRGLARFLDPDVLQRFELTDYLELVPEAWQKSWREALRYARAEPYEGFWPPIKTGLLNNHVLSPALSREEFDWRGALIAAQETANAGLMYPRTDEEMRRYRPWGWGGVTLLGLVFGSIMVWLVRGLRERAGPPGASPRRRARSGVLAPAVLLAPALILIAVWSYYPLLRGGVMAFQDYRITGESRWVGVDNFINVYLDPSFWISMRQTFKYVLLTLLLGFTAPLGLALLLTEVPRFKVFFRTLFFLPQVSSGLVILFLWKLFYDPSPAGYLNRILWFLDPVDWLGDPRWAMVAVILPGVWAGAGLGSLIYQAALKIIPEDLYEAATMDGAGIFHSFRHVTLPYLAPLLIINFVGAFVGTFHAMGNIFALTAGGPGNETLVLSLAIWFEAFAFLRFGTATAMAWILGAILIGFTLVQLRALRRVEFRRAGTE